MTMLLHLMMSEINKQFKQFLKLPVPVFLNFCDSVRLYEIAQ